MSDTWKNLEGQKDELVGKVKEMWGKARNDAETQAKGIAQQVEGEIKQAVAKGRAHEDELLESARERAKDADAQVKRQISDTQESINQAADENLQSAIAEGKRLKDEAAEKAEALRQQAIEENEIVKEEARERYTRAQEEADKVLDRATKAIDEGIKDREIIEAQEQQDHSEDDTEVQQANFSDHLARVEEAERNPDNEADVPHQQGSGQEQN